MNYERGARALAGLRELEFGGKGESVCLSRKCQVNMGVCLRNIGDEEATKSCGGIVAGGGWKSCADR